MGTIMIVEDDEKIATLLADHLRHSGFDSVWLGDGSKVAPRVREQMPDLILLDLMLPGRNGVEICQEIRTFSEVPIIMVTARDGVDDRLLGLEIGADNYICKPFSPREVVARVKMVLRRAGGCGTATRYEIDFDAERFRVSLNGKDLELTVVEYKILQHLSGTPGRIYSRKQIMLHIYPGQRIVCDRTIDSHIKNLRRKMVEATPGVDLIQSLYGIGYKFEVP